MTNISFSMTRFGCVSWSPPVLYRSVRSALFDFSSFVHFFTSFFFSRLAYWCQSIYFTSFHSSFHFSFVHIYFPYDYLVFCLYLSTFFFRFSLFYYFSFVRVSTVAGRFSSQFSTFLIDIHTKTEMIAYISHTYNCVISGIKRARKKRAETDDFLLLLSCCEKNTFPTLQLFHFARFLPSNFLRLLRRCRSFGLQKNKIGKKY